MVVASVPLWVVHSSGSGPSSTSANGPSTDPSSSNPSSSTDPASTSLSNPASAQASAQAAQASAAQASKEREAASDLLSQLSGTASRTSIYSCDVHPGGLRFATAGGDGTVKVWGLRSVFGREGLDDDAMGGSKGSSSGDEDDPKEGEGIKTNDTNSGQEKARGAKENKSKKAVAHYDSAGIYHSSDPSSEEEMVCPPDGRMPPPPPANAAVANAATNAAGSCVDANGANNDLNGEDNANGAANTDATVPEEELHKLAHIEALLKDGIGTERPTKKSSAANADVEMVDAANASGGAAPNTTTATNTATTTTPTNAGSAPIVQPSVSSTVTTNNTSAQPSATHAVSIQPSSATIQPSSTQVVSVPVVPAAAPPPMMVVKGKDGKKRKRAVLLSTTPFDADGAAAIGGGGGGGGVGVGGGVGGASGGGFNSRNGIVFGSSNGINNGSGENGQTEEEIIGSHRLLCTLSSHSGSVLSVRWSTGGRYLASAGDDSLVLIYAKSNRSSSALGMQSRNLLSAGADASSPDIEHWTRIRICRGHNLDVVGLAWSPDDTHLVSCSLDSASPICVWRLNLDEAGSGGGGNGGGGGFGSPARPGFGSPSRGGVGGGASAILTPYKTLSATSSSSSSSHEGHTSTVKGVAFDPTGKYLASSADDPSVCIWRAYDDWGLEAKVDQSGGIFGGSTASSNKDADEDASDDAAAREERQQLASLSLFRRISFSPDGVHVCVTNATVRGKSVASTVSREGWKTACEKPLPVGAANLVGHKAAVVTSRHCPYFLGGRKLRKRPGGSDGSSEEEDEEAESSEDENTEPNYATLLALGDKRGFVTVWSTKSRSPIFKAQVSETRCTITDMSWALMPPSGQSSAGDKSPAKSKDLVLLISLLDGHIAALRFGIPNELGSLLPESSKYKIFRLKYGINLRESLASGRLVDAGADKPRLIENALQLTMEDFGDNDDDDDDMMALDDDEEDGDDNNDKAAALRRQIDGRAAQTESRAGDKKRAKPILMSASGGRTSEEEDDRLSRLEDRLSDDDGDTGSPSSKKRKQGDAVNDVLDGAADAAETAESLSKNGDGSKRQILDNGEEKKDDGDAPRPPSAAPAQPQQPAQDHQPRRRAGASTMRYVGPIIAAPSQRVLTVHLPVCSAPEDDDLLMGGVNGGASTVNSTTPQAPLVVDCSNVSIPNPTSAPGKNQSQSQVPSVNVTISQSGQAKYRDTLFGATATAVFATESILAIGTYDGTIYLYGTSPSTGWKSGLAFRCHSPLIFGGSIVRLHLRESKSKSATSIPTPDSVAPSSTVEMLVVAANCDFGYYTLVPKPSLRYRGTVMPPMEHMRLSSRDTSPHRHHHKGHGQVPLPELARITITDSGRLLLLLTYPQSGSKQGRQGSGAFPVSLPGGNLQAFNYDHEMKLWIRVSDSRFTLSDFYDLQPNPRSSSTLRASPGFLAQIDTATQIGNRPGGTSVSSIYRQSTASGTSNLRTTISRAHCEDRMACALALGSKDEFEGWLGLYARRLSLEGDERHLRLLVDLLLGMNEAGDEDEAMTGNCSGASVCWWLSSAESIIGMDRKQCVRKVVLPEISKNRSNQRLVNEIATELSAL